MTRCAAGAAHRYPTLTVILTLPSRLHPPRPHPHPRPHRPMARAVGPRLTRCPTLALAPGGWRPRGRGRSTRRVLPRVVAARPHAGSALRRVTPATRRLRGPRAGTERESVDAAGWSPVRSAACKRSHESPHSSPLCFLRLRLVGLASTRSLHCHVPVGSTAPLLVDRSQDRVRPRPCTACSRSHGALTHGVRAAQRVALPPRLRPLLLRPRLVPTHRRFVARPSRFRSRKGHWATARACTGEVRGQLLPLARSRPGKLVDACLASTSGVMCSVR